MVSEKSADPPEQDEGALAAEVRALRALLEELQSGLGPGVQLLEQRPQGPDLRGQGALVLFRGICRFLRHHSAEPW